MMKQFYPLILESSDLSPHSHSAFNSQPLWFALAVPKISPIVYHSKYGVVHIGVANVNISETAIFCFSLNSNTNFSEDHISPISIKFAAACIKSRHSHFRANILWNASATELNYMLPLTKRETNNTEKKLSWTFQNGHHVADLRTTESNIDADDSNML